MIFKQDTSDQNVTANVLLVHERWTGWGEDSRGAHKELITDEELNEELTLYKAIIQPRR